MLELINNFLEVQALLLTQTPVEFQRAFHGSVDWKNRLIGIVGPRGVGKTTILLQHIAKSEIQRDQILYISADSVLLGNSSLFELAKTFHIKLGGRLLVIDEIHRCQNWSAELKTIYDSLPKLQVIFSGSSQINILEGRADLSRRAAIYVAPGLSFREYLELEHSIKLPIIPLGRLFAEHQEVSNELSLNGSILKQFHDYLQSGYYPFFKETGDQALYFKQIINSIDKSIFSDIPAIANIQTDSLVVFKEILIFLSSITPGEINIHKIAKNIGKKDDTIKSYLQVLHDTAILRFLPNSLAGHAKLKSAQKIFFDNTNLLNAMCYFTGRSADKGLVRETFVVEQLQSAGHIPLYSKNGDLEVNGLNLEIGGPSKGQHQIKKSTKGIVVSDEIIVSVSNKMPLYLMGFLY